MKTKQEAFNERQIYHRELIRTRIQRYGFVVKNVYAFDIPNTDPSTGFVVTIVQREAPASRKFIEWLLKDYAFRLEFVEQMELALDKSPVTDKVSV
jgi:hypothetical protein